MAINYNGARQKVNELNRIAIKIVDMLAILERGSIVNAVIVLTPGQVTEMKVHLETEGNTLKTVAGEIKDLVKE